MIKKEKPKQVRVSFYVDEDVVEYFKDVGVIENRPYSPIMARVLKNHVEQKIQAGILQRK